VAREIKLLVDNDYQLSRCFAVSIAAFEHEAQRHHTHIDRLTTPEALETLEPGTPIVLTSTSSNWLDGLSDRLKKLSLRPILMGASPEWLPGASGVTVDRHQLTVTMLQCFADRTRLAFVGYEPANANDLIRATAFKTIVGPSARLYPLPESLEECAENFLKDAKEFDGIICPNDYIAIYMMDVLRKAGFRLPEDIYIAGSGDTILGRFTHPTLTTTALDYHEMGRRTYYIWRLIGDDASWPPFSLMLPTRLIQRASTGCSVKPVTQMQSMASWEPPIQSDAHVSLFPLYILENALENCDELDYKLIGLLEAGRGYEAITEELFITEGAVRYRVKRLLSSMNLENRKAFEKRWHAL